MADGVNIQAGDVVDIVDGKVTKSYITEIQLSKYKDWANGVAAAKVTNDLSVIMIYRNVSTENYILLIDNNNGEIISSCQYYNSSGISDIKIVRVRDDAIAAFFRYDASWHCTLCTITNNVIETTLQDFRVTGLDCLDVLPYDQNTILIFQANSGASDTTGKLGCGILQINDQFNSISTKFIYELSSSTRVRFASSCVIEEDGAKKIFIAYNLSQINSKMYYMVVEYRNETINIIKGETQLTASSYMYIHCINYNDEIAITYYIPNQNQNTANYYIDIFGLDASNNIISRRGVQYLTNLNQYRNAYPVAVNGGCAILNIGTTKTLTYIKDSGNLLAVSETVDISQANTEIMSGACSSISNNRFLIAFAQQTPTGANYTIFFRPFQIFNDSICTDVKWSSKDAIALTSGTGTVDIGFAGIIEANWISQGDIISSPGVCGIGVLNNVLQIIQPSPQSCQIAYGSYDGTGQYGESNPNILEFDFNPKIVLVSAETGLLRYNISGYGVHFDSFIWTIGMTSTRTYGGSGVTNDVISFVTTGSTLKWYLSTGSDARGQMNMEGKTYYYIAIG